MGRGNFSVVYSAKDTQAKNAIVALKFVKKEYAHDAKFEHDILKAIREANPTGAEKVLTMIDHFAYNRHPCFVLAPKGCPLKARRFGLREGHVSRNELRNLAKQMLEALSFLHFKMKLVHTDLKPENILLDNNMPVGAKGLGEGFTIVDFGSASFYRMDRLDSDLISTRPYRSPEVVMGNGWYFPADTWSMGCILYEVYTGHKLFDVNDDNIHLAQMQTRLGALPKSFTHDSQNSRKFFDSMGQLSRGNLRAAPYIRSVTEELRDDSTFCDLILSMLAYEPARRIRCDDALRHPFITGEQTLRKSPSPMAEVPSNIPLRPIVSKDPSPATVPMPMPSTSSYPLDKENAVRGAAAMVPPLSKQPLYNNIRLSGLSAIPSVNAPLTARSSSASTNPYYAAPSTTAAPLTSRPSLISPAQSVAAVPHHRPMPSATSALDDRYNALKRTKSDPSQMPVAGRASGIQYNRLW